MNGPIGPQDCPYVGLEPFEAAHARYFFGRRQDSRVLADHVRARKLTVFYGASGTGKTSVLNVGLRAELRNSGVTTAMLRDWQDPVTLNRRACAAVFEALTPDLRAKLPRRWHDPETRPQFVRFVVGVIRRTGHPLLLILDQFEEYFLYRNLYRNRDEMRRTEVAIGKLVARSEFPFHLLLSMRDDGLHRLDELRAFIPGILDTTVRLGHLSDAGVADAIKGPIRRYNEDYRVNGEPIIVEEQLVSTLIEQLKQAEPGLGKGDAATPAGRPIELSYLQLTLMKLWDAEGGPNATGLRAKTLTETLGGVGQILRAHIADVMKRLSAKDQDLCARVFDRLVTGIGSKIAYPTKGLAAVDVAGPEVDEATVERVLMKLTPKESRILKTVNTNGMPGFELFHDVLGLPVLEWKRGYQAEARRKEEAAAAEERRQEELAAAERRLQEQLAAAEARRQEERAQRRRIALFIGVLFLVALSAITVFALYQSQIALYQRNQAEQAAKQLQQERILVEAQRQAEVANQARNEANLAREQAVKDRNSADEALGNGWWSKFSFSADALTPEEVDALWRIALATEHFRKGFVGRLTADRADSSVIATFSKRPAPILLALGLNWPFSPQADTAVTSILRARIEQPEGLRARSLALKALTNRLSAERSRSAVAPILSAMGRAIEELSAVDRQDPEAGRRPDQDPDPDLDRRRTDVTKLAEALEALPEPMAVEGVPSTLALMMPLAASTRNSDVRRTVIDAAHMFAARLVPEQASSLLADAVKMLKDQTRPTSIGALVEILEKFPVKLSPEQTNEVLDPILRLFTKVKDPEGLHALAQALGTLPTTLTAKQSQDVVRPILAALRVSKPEESSEELTAALLALAPKLSSPAAADALQTLLARAKDLEVEQALTALAPRLDPERARTQQSRILATFARGADRESPSDLAATLDALPLELTPEQAQAALAPILRSMTSKPNDSTMVPAVRTLVGRLTPAQAREALVSVLTILGSTRSNVARAALVRAVGTLAEKLSAQDAQVVFDRYLQQLAGARDIAVTALAMAAPALAKRTDKEKAQTAVEPLIQAIARTQSATAHASLAEAIKALGVPLTPAQSELATKPILEALRSVRNPNASSQAVSMRTWMRALTALPVTWSAEQVQSLLDQLVRALDNATNPVAIDMLAQSLSLLLPKVGANQAPAVLAVVLGVIEKTDSSAAIRSLMPASQQLAAKLSPEERDRTLSQVRPLLADTRVENVADALVNILLEVSGSKSDEEYLTAVVETLKYPTVTGRPTDRLIDALRARFPNALSARFRNAPGAKDGLARVVAWLEARLGSDAVIRLPIRPGGSAPH